MAPQSFLPFPVQHRPRKVGENLSDRQPKLPGQGSSECLPPSLPVASSNFRCQALLSHHRLQPGSCIAISSRSNRQLGMTPIGVFTWRFDCRQFNVPAEADAEQRTVSALCALTAFPIDLMHGGPTTRLAGLACPPKLRQLFRDGESQLEQIWTRFWPTQ